MKDEDSSSLAVVIGSSSGERKELQAKQLETTLIEWSPDCITVLDLEGRLLMMNFGGMQVLEICDLAEIQGLSWIDSWRDQHRDLARRAVESARRGEIGHFTGNYPTAGG